MMFAILDDVGFDREMAQKVFNMFHDKYTFIAPQIHIANRILNLSSTYNDMEM